VYFVFEAIHRNGVPMDIGNTSKSIAKAGKSTILVCADKYIGFSKFIMIKMQNVYSWKNQNLEKYFIFSFLF
jgi:hypothetical protein